MSSRKANAKRIRPVKPLKSVETSGYTDGLEPQTPLDDESSRSSSPALRRRNGSPALDKWSTKSKGLWADLKSLRWVVVPSSSFKMLLVPIVLWANWELFAPYIAKDLPNPFAPLIFISHPAPSSDGDIRYQKGWLDLVFLAYYIVVWSFFRQAITLHFFHPLAQWFGIKKPGKIARFGEQGHAMVYFAVMSCWGVRVMATLPTWWYRTEYFWIDYPHWRMTPELKSYYLMQAAYWCQQLMVLLLGLEKPRKDQNELVAHHIVTLWLVGWSYLVNMTYIGNAVYLSMDLPDSLLAFSKLLNYLQLDNVKIVVFIFFLGVWTYLRHWLNLVMLYSVWTQFDLMPETSKRWAPSDGVWMAWWMKYQVFIPILLLQFLQLFWYFLILRIAYRAITEFKADDTRSDDEDDGQHDEDESTKDD